MSRTPGGAELIALEGYTLLKQWLIDHTGLAYYADKDEDLGERLAERFKALDLSTPVRYLDYLRQTPAELAALIEQLTIGETYFFRYREQFDTLRDRILPELLAARPAGRPLRIWSAGCASGEECYSLAILLARHWPELPEAAAEILATDINGAFLELARRACYRDWSFRQSDEDFRERYFDSVKEEERPCWRLRPHWRQRVRFLRQNLIQDEPPGSGFDLIMCRNVLIYFDAATQRRLIERFYASLRPSGWLVLGPSELSPLASRPFLPQPLASLSCYQREPLTQVKGQPESLSAQAVPPPAAPKPKPDWRPAVRAPQPPAASAAPPASATSAEAPATLASLRALADRGRLDEAEARCRELLARDELNADLHYALAQLLSGRGRDEDVLTQLQRTIYLDHRHVLAHYRLGLLLRKRGQAEAAARAFRNAARLLAGRDDEAMLLDELSIGQLRALLRSQGAL